VHLKSVENDKESQSKRSAKVNSKRFLKTFKNVAAPLSGFLNVSSYLGEQKNIDN